MLRYAVFVCLLLKIYGFTSNCVKENQFKSYEFPVEGCSQTFGEKCRVPEAGSLKSLGGISLVKIGITDIVPTCAFHNLVGLKHIHGVNSDIKVLADSAFTDLAELTSINLAFNSIREVRQVVFRNVSAEIIDFSWNKLLFIDSQTFSQINGLKYLNVSHNFLQTLSIKFLPKSILSVNASHNLLTRFAAYSHNYDNLTILDWSSNLLESIAISFSYPAELIDLTDNHLRTLDFLEIDSIEIFKIAQNHFEIFPKYVEYVNAKYIDIHPNPWKCHELRRLWATLTSLNTQVIAKVSADGSQAECVTNDGHFLTSKRDFLLCTDDDECPGNMVCKAKKCWDPCQYSLCHPSSNCKTVNHRMDCTCIAGFLRNPMELSGECRKVDCFVNSHCKSNAKCYDQKCFVVSYYPAKPPRFDEKAESMPTDDEEEPWWYDDIPKKKPSQQRIRSSS